jgi:hypothetical protein
MLFIAHLLSPPAQNILCDKSKSQLPAVFEKTDPLHLCVCISLASFA